MTTVNLYKKMKEALDNSPRQAWTAELHLQVIKYSQEFKTTSGKEFCEELGINASYGTEFAKMKKIADRLIDAGLDVKKI